MLHSGTFYVFGMLLLGLTDGKEYICSVTAYTVYLVRRTRYRSDIDLHTEYKYVNM